MKISYLNSKDTKNKLIDCIKNVEEYFILISPFISEEILEEIYRVDLKAHIQKILIYNDIGTKATSIDLEKAFKNGFRVFQLENLHAKIYLIDGKYQIMGSSNLTRAGFGKNEESNIYHEAEGLEEKNEMLANIKRILLNSIEIFNSKNKNSISDKNKEVKNEIVIEMLVSSDIEDEELNNQIIEKIGKENGKTLYIGATSNLVELRERKLIKKNASSSLKQQEELRIKLKKLVETYEKDSSLENILKEKELINKIEELKSDFNLLSFTNLRAEIAKSIDNKIIRNIEIRNIINEIIKENNIFINLQSELFELFDFISFYEIDILEKQFEEIKKIIEEEIKLPSELLVKIFKMYQEYREKLKEKKLEENINTYQEEIKERLSNYIRKYERIFFEGFLFFNDLQEYILDIAISEGKEIFFVSKYSYLKETDSFLFEKLDSTLKKLCEKRNKKFTFKKPPYINKGRKEIKNNLYRLKKVYPKIKEDEILEENKVYDIEDKNSLQIINPFRNRSDEFNWITKNISEKIKNNFLRSGICKNINGILEFSNIEEKEEKIKLELENYFITIAVDTDNYIQTLSHYFYKYGIFTFEKENKLLEKIYLQDRNIFMKIFFGRDEVYKYLKAFEITEEEKIKIFQSMERIKLETKLRPLNSYPVGEFIFQLFDISNTGIDIEKFEKLILSNWFKFSYCNKKYKNEDILREFLKLKVFFERSTTIKEWQEMFNKIDQIMNMSELEKMNYHPLNKVDKDILNIIKAMVEYIEKFIVDFENEFSEKKELKEYISYTYRMMFEKNENDIFQLNNFENNKEEMKISEKIKEVFMSYSESDIIQFNRKDFAEQVRLMIQDWDNEEKREINNIGKYSITIGNLENMRKYKYVFFPLFESNKYPRPYHDKFPFSEEILCILKNNLNISPSDRNGLDYHLKLERYLIKNVIDFANEELIITWSKKEGDQLNSNSLYLEHISTTLGCNLEEIYIKIKVEDNIKKEKIEQCLLDDCKIEDLKKIYLEEMYHSDIFGMKNYAANFLRYKVFRSFKGKLKNEDIIQLKDNFMKKQKEFIKKEYFNLFPFFNDSEKQDIINNNNNKYSSIIKKTNDNLNDKADIELEPFNLIINGNKISLNTTIHSFSRNEKGTNCKYCCAKNICKNHKIMLRENQDEDKDIS